MSHGLNRKFDYSDIVARDGDDKSVECCRLESGGYRPVAEGEGDAMLDHPGWDGLVVDLAGLWSQSPFS